MGIADREYIRNAPRSSSGIASLRGWSFNTWLIVINIAVFLIGGIFFSGAGIPVVFKQTIDPQYTGGQAYPGPMLSASGMEIPDNAKLPLGAAVTRRLFDPATSRPVGVEVLIVQDPLTAYGHFSTAKAFGGFEVWRFITFQFLHAGVTHLAFNIMGLWFVGGLVEQYLGARRYAAFYLVCGICGALMYLALNLIGYVLKYPMGSSLNIPGLLFDDRHTPLVGASAGIFGVMLAAAFIAPRATVSIMGIIPMQMRTAVYLFVGIAAISLLIGTNNAGGEAAHLGGAIAGFYFIRHTHLLRDFFDVFNDSRRKGVRAKADSGPDSSRPTPNDAEIDRILTKVKESGLHSLNDGERTALRRGTESRRRR